MAAPNTGSRLSYTTLDMMVNAPLHEWDKPTLVHETQGGFSNGRMWRPARPDVQGFEKPATFNFLYNPTTVSSSASMNSQWDWESQTGSPPPLALESYSFSLFLNRTSDVAYNRIAEGTLHDIEILWRLFNGAPQGSAGTADRGWIIASYVTVLLGQYFSFTGYCTSISIQHEKFGPTMVPVISEVSLSFTRAVAGVLADGTVPGAPTPTGSSGNTPTAGQGPTGI